MIIGAPPAVRARALKAPGAFSRPLRAARRLRKNNGVRFRDGPGRFFPGTARNVRRNLFGFEGRNADSWMWRRARWKKKGTVGGLAVQRQNVRGQKGEVFRRADRAPARGTGSDPNGTCGAN